MALAREGTEGQKTRAVATLTFLARHNAENQAAIVEAGVLVPLLTLEHDGTAEHKKVAAIALRILAADHPANMEAIEKARKDMDDAHREAAAMAATGCVTLLTLVRRGTRQTKANAALGLAALAADDPAQKDAIREAGGVEVLMTLMRDESGTVDEKCNAAIALAKLADGNAENKEAIRDAGGVTPLVTLARDGIKKQPSAAAHALASLADGNATNQDAIRAAGGVTVLVALARKNTPWAELALESLRSNPWNADNAAAIVEALNTNNPSSAAGPSSAAAAGPSSAATGTAAGDGELDAMIEQHNAGLTAAVARETGLNEQQQAWFRFYTTSQPSDMPWPPPARWKNL